MNEGKKLLNNAAEIIAYFNENYIEQWLAYFNDKKSKKAIWETVSKMGIEKSSLSTFYSHQHFLIIEKYIRRFVQIQNIPKIMEVLNIKDQNIEEALQEALRIYEARERAEFNEAYAHWRMKK